MRSSSRRSKLHSAAISRYFLGMPVIDAKESLRVFVDEADVKRARQKDPAGCVYANACRRLFGSSAILFFRSIAYVDLPDSDGNRVVNRFTLDREVRQRIVEFDRTGKAAPGGFLLSAPRPSKTLDAVNEKNRTYKKRRAAGAPKSAAHRKAYLKGRAVIAAMGTAVRDGAGMVHFIK